MTEARKSFLNMISGLVYQMVSVVVGLIIPRLILVYFGSETNGLLNSLTQIFQYMALLEAGVGVVSTQVLYRRISKKDYCGIRSCLTATAYYYRNTGILYTDVVLIFSIIYPIIISSELPSLSVSWLIISFGINGALNFFVAGKYKILLEADGRKYIINVAALTAAILSNLTKTFLILKGYSIVIVQLGYSLISLLQLLMISCYAKSQYQWLRKRTSPDFHAITQRYSALIHQVSGLIFGSTDMILLTAMCDLKIVSVYATYNMVANMVNNLLSQVSGSVSFKMGQLYQADKEKYIIFHHMFEIVNFILVFTAFTILYLFLLPFMALYTKGITDINYLDPKLPLLFVLVQLLSAGRTASGNVINYAGHFQKTQWRAIFESVINLTVSIIGIYYLGIYGALLGTIAALLYRSNDVTWYAAKKLLGIRPWYTYRRWLSCGIIFLAITILSKKINFMSKSYLQLFGKAVITGIILFMIYSIVEGIIERKAIIKWFRTQKFV